jgi:hypothetical protein
VLISGSAIYESYDEGWNVIITIPYLDQNAKDTLDGEQLISLDACSCPLTPSRDRIVAKRARILGKPLESPSSMDIDKGVDEGVHSYIDGPLDPNFHLAESMDLDPTPIVDIHPTPSDRQFNVPLALNGPATLLIKGMLEPSGPLILTGEHTYLVLHSHLITHRLREQGSFNREFRSSSIVWY